MTPTVVPRYRQEREAVYEHKEVRTFVFIFVMALCGIVTYGRTVTHDFVRNH